MNFVSIPFADIIKATAVPKMKRMPKGVTGHLDKFTIINFHPTFVVFDAPTHSTVIPVKNGFKHDIKINSLQLSSTLQKLTKVDTIELGFDPKGSLLKVKCDGMEVNIVVEKI